MYYRGKRKKEASKMVDRREDRGDHLLVLQKGTVGHRGSRERQIQPAMERKTYRW